MAQLMSVVMGLASIVSIVCWIMILIKIFKRNVGLGILGIICGLFTFIYGWVKVKEFDCKKVMVIWTVAFVVTLIAQAMGAGAMFQQLMGEMQTAG